MSDPAIHKVLRDIAGSMKDLVRVMSAINQNMVAFAKQTQESDDKYDKIMSEKGDMLALIPRDYVAPEGYAAGADYFPYSRPAKNDDPIKKEGE